MRRGLHPALGRIRSALERNDRRCDRHFTADHFEVGDPPDMPELHEDISALCMDGFRDFPPTSDVLIAIDPRCTQIPAAAAGYYGPLCDDKAALRGSLSVVFSHQLPYHITRDFRPLSRTMRHHNTM